MTAEPHRAARVQHTLDSAIFTAGEGARREVVPGSECAPQHARAAPRRAGRPPCEPGRGPGLDAATLPLAGPEAHCPEGTRPQLEVSIVRGGRRLLEGPSALVGPWGLGAAGAALDL